MHKDQLRRNNVHIFDYESPLEIMRLTEQMWLVIKAMGGPLVGLPDHRLMHRVLDISCGPGDWAMNIAFSHPQLEIAGIDFNQTIVDYANAKARSQGLRNVSFGVMDSLGESGFSDNTFDLVHASFLSVHVPRDSWMPLLKECLRVLRPGGTLRLIDSDGVITNSLICENFNAMLCQTLYTAGYGFSLDGRTLGITPVMEKLLMKTGFLQTHSTPYVVNFSADSPTWLDVYRSLEIAGQLLKSVLLEKGLVEAPEIEQAYQQGLIEMLKGDFCGIWPFLSVCGVKPGE